jgi:hypothetical protein
LDKVLVVLEAHQVMGVVAVVLRVAEVDLVVVLVEHHLPEIVRQVLVMVVFMVVVLGHLKVVHLEQLEAVLSVSSGQAMHVHSHLLVQLTSNNFLIGEKNESLYRNRKWCNKKSSRF